jgi:hypothetical protein
MVADQRATLRRMTRVKRKSTVLCRLRVAAFTVCMRLEARCRAAAHSDMELAASAAAGGAGEGAATAAPGGQAGVWGGGGGGGPAGGAGRPSWSDVISR